MDLTAAKRKLHGIIKKTIIIAVLLIIGSLFFKSKTVFFGVALGGILSVVNLLIIARVVEIIVREQRSAKVLAGISYLIQTTLLFLIVCFIGTHDSVNLFAFSVGFSAVILGSLAEVGFSGRL